jgi:hypothetical protein
MSSIVIGHVLVRHEVSKGSEEKPENALLSMVDALNIRSVTISSGPHFPIFALLFQSLPFLSFSPRPDFNSGHLAV